MGVLEAIGGFAIDSAVASTLEREIEELCALAGFGESEFKWSPGRDLWMHANLVGDKRRRFFSAILDGLAKFDARAIVAVVDSSKSSATGANDPVLDAATLFLERMEKTCARRQSSGIALCDRPSGSRKDETRFMDGCRATLNQGTAYVTFERISHLSLLPSKQSRLVQAADLITGCTAAVVGGEDRHAPKIFKRILPLLDRRATQVGGVGLKIHPHYRYLNLYHWVLGEAYLWRGNTADRYPLLKYPYAVNPLKPYEREDSETIRVAVPPSPRRHSNLGSSHAQGA